MKKRSSGGLNWIKKNSLKFIVLLLIICIFLYYGIEYIMPVSSRRITSVDGKGIADLVLIYAPWCGHSKNMLSDYDKVIRDYHGRKINGYTLNILKYNSDVDKEEVKKRAVKGFPSLFFEKDGESREFNKRKYNDIVDELKSLLS